MRFKLLVAATSALAMVALALAIRMGDDSDASSAHSTKSPLSAPQQKYHTKNRLGFVKQLADDPHAALESLLQSPGRDQNGSLCADPHLQSAVVDAANRLALSTHPKWGKDDPVALENFVQLWAQADLTSAYEWVQHHPTGSARDALMTRVAFVGAQSDPNAAAWLVAEEIPPGYIHEEAVVMVLHQWAIQDPASAAAWVNLFPDTPFRDRALRELEGVISHSRSGLAAP
ncbi:hypothetical protein [Verrucomicrobium sp. BvORR034]|uniref:hypothetical protein n=1 Tax=Verrucomicrobium sp. BvORR034 TaxID=1396418 RepID=UPI002240F33F|nr:hypothetical protein [Verrucomicrobium sp. BvORR034]